MPLKREWFLKKENVDVLSVDNLDAQQAGECVLRWVLQCRAQFL